MSSVKYIPRGNLKREGNQGELSRGQIGKDERRKTLKVMGEKLAGGKSKRGGGRPEKGNMDTPTPKGLRARRPTSGRT